MSAALPAHVDESDLISYGLLGLIGAVERFEPTRSVKFETYAVSRIKGAIIDELRSLDWVPRSVRARAREMERKAAELEHQLRRAPTDEELASALDIGLKEFHDFLNQMSTSSIVALDEMWSVNTGSESLSLIDTLGDRNAGQPGEPARRHRAARRVGRCHRLVAGAREDRGRALLLRRAHPA